MHHVTYPVKNKFVTKKDLRYEFEGRMNVLFNMCHCVAIQV